MAHGMFKIKVVKVTNEEMIFEYAACVHPQKGETIYLDGKRIGVCHVNHILRTERDGSGEYQTLDHVQVMVSK